MAEAQKTYATIPGSEGNPYVVFARRGKIALGVRPLGMQAGVNMQQPELTWFGVRLRSARDEGFEIPKGKVVDLATEVLEPHTAWDKVAWEKRSNVRASLIAGVMVTGRIDAGPKEAAPLLEAMQKGLLGRMAAKHVTSYVAAEYLVLQSSTLAEILNDNFIFPLAKKFAEDVEKAAGMQEVLKANVGVFMSSAELLKKAYGKTKADDVADIGDA